MQDLSSTFCRAALTLCFAAAALATAGCATPPPRPIGAVLPMEGGKYQSTIKSGDQAQAMKTFSHDAEATCYKGDGGARMPWEGKPAAAKYVVVSQSIKSKDGKEIKSDNKMLDAGIAVGLRRAGLESKDSVEVTTVFRCE